MSDGFGDFELDDAADTERADPEQTAMRLHELRAYLAANSGEELAAWDALDVDERGVGEMLAGRLIDALLSDPASAPRDLHSAIAYLSGQPEWDDLDADVQQVGAGLVDDILAWLSRQGSLR